MSARHFFAAGLLAAIVQLVSCGGETIDGTLTAGSGFQPVSTANQTLLKSGVNLIAPSTELPSAANDVGSGLQITALVLDERNQAIANAPVVFSASSGALVVTQATTNDSGVATAVLHTANDPTLRTINVTARAGTATAGGGSGSLTVNVVGTRILLTGPGAIATNSNGDLTARLIDSAGNALAGRSVSFRNTQGSNSLSASNVVTDTGGGAAVRLLTGSAQGADVITASALGTQATFTVNVSPESFVFLQPAEGAQLPIGTNVPVRVKFTNNGVPVVNKGVNFSTSRGTYTPMASANTNAQGEAEVTLNSSAAGLTFLAATIPGGPSAQRSVEFVASTPASLALSADPATVASGATSTLRAFVRDGLGNPVKGKVVEFISTQDPSFGSVNPATAMTNSQGVAQSQFTGGSANGSVTILARVLETPAAQGTANITVGAQTLRITLGTGNRIFGDDDIDVTFFRLPYTVIVADAAGNQINNATVRLSVTPLRFRKGQMVAAICGSGTTPNCIRPNTTAECPNEDVDLDGVLELGEDIDGDGQLDPGNVATVPSTVSSTTTTTTDGVTTTKPTEFFVTYPRDRNTWVDVRLRASVSVAGSEGTATAEFTLPGRAEDFDSANDNPPGNPSPYGQASSCSNPN